MATTLLQNNYMKLIERKKCPFCDSTKIQNLYSKFFTEKSVSKFLNDYYKNTKLIGFIKNYKFIISECKDCSFVFQKNIPDNKFSKFIYNELISRKESLKKKMKFNSQNYYQYFKDATLIESLTKKNNNQVSILEFGSGWGFWARFMKSLNFNVSTCEISKYRISHIKKNGIKNYNNLQRINKKFDIIYSDQVLEHVNDPKIVLKSLSKLLKRDGYMIHKFPSTFFFKSKLKYNYNAKKDCAHPLEHINLLNMKSIKLLAKKLSLKIFFPYYIKKYSLIDNALMYRNYLKCSSIILKK